MALAQSISIVASPEAAFPTLSQTEIENLEKFGTAADYAEGQIVFEAGQPRLDLFVVVSGAIEIQNPADGDRVVHTHKPGGFAGDIDLLTGRPVLVRGIARGDSHLLRVPSCKVRAVLNRTPTLGDKLMRAFTHRRQLLQEGGPLGLQVLGAGHCKDTNLIREFLFKNFVPFTWHDLDSPDGQRYFHDWGSPPKMPVVECGDGTRLVRPSLRKLSECAGVWRECPVAPVNLAIVGAGPGGLSAGVYAASEGLTTLVLDQLGPGGQAGSSSKIENFIGFPAGLSGAELAMRGVLQLLKFGGQIVAPVIVDRIEPAKRRGEPHVLHLDCGARIKADVVLMATGVRWRRLSAEGAAHFEDAGIHYVCTAVEAELYDGCDVVVVGGGNSAGQAAMFLAGCCPSRRVTLLVRSKLGNSMSEYLVERIRNTSNIDVREGMEVATVHGDRKVESIDLRSTGNGKSERLHCEALFVFIGAEPAAKWIPDEVARDDKGYVLTGATLMQANRWPLKDREPCPLETSIPGILAAGDLRAGSTKRVGFAVGDGSMAVTCVHTLLSYRAGQLPPQ